MFSSDMSGPSGAAIHPSFIASAIICEGSTPGLIRRFMLVSIPLSVNHVGKRGGIPVAAQSVAGLAAVQAVSKSPRSVASRDGEGLATEVTAARRVIAGHSVKATARRTSARPDAAVWRPESPTDAPSKHCAIGQAPSVIAAWLVGPYIVRPPCCTVRVYATAVRQMLPDATLTADLFHVVQLAVKANGNVRCRRSGDPQYGIKSLLVRNLEHLSPSQFAKIIYILDHDR
jgi:hypothetical protein